MRAEAPAVSSVRRVASSMRADSGDAPARVPGGRGDGLQAQIANFPGQPVPAEEPHPTLIAGVPDKPVL
jgi:hypothetical protein